MAKYSKLDVLYSWVHSSQLFLYIKIIAFLCFVASCSYTVAKFTTNGGHKVEPPTYKKG